MLKIKKKKKYTVERGKPAGYNDWYITTGTEVMNRIASPIKALLGNSELFFSRKCFFGSVVDFFLFLEKNANKNMLF